MEKKSEAVDRRQLLKFAGLSTLAGLSGMGCGGSTSFATSGISPAVAQTATEGTLTPNFLNFQRGRLGQVDDLGGGRFRVTLDDVSLSLVISTPLGFSDLESLQTFVDAFQERYSSTSALGTLHYRDAQGTGVVFAAILTSPTTDGSSLTFMAEAIEALPGSFNAGQDTPTATLPSSGVVGPPTGEVSLIIQGKEVTTEKDFSIKVRGTSFTTRTAVFDGPEVVDASQGAIIDFRGVDAVFAAETPGVLSAEISATYFDGSQTPSDSDLTAAFESDGQVFLRGDNRERYSIVLRPTSISGPVPEDVVVTFTEGAVTKAIRVCL